METTPTFACRPGEVVDHRVEVRIDPKAPLTVVFTNQRVAWWEADGTIHHIEAARVTRLKWGRPSWWSTLLISVSLLVGGGVMLALDYIGMPCVMVLVAPGYPILARRKRTLLVVGEQGRLSWTAPVAFGAAASATLAELDTAVRRFAQRVSSSAVIDMMSAS